MIDKAFVDEQRKIFEENTFHKDLKTKIEKAAKNGENVIWSVRTCEQKIIARFERQQEFLSSIGLYYSFEKYGPMYETGTRNIFHDCVIKITF